MRPIAALVLGIFTLAAGACPSSRGTRTAAPSVLTAPAAPVAPTPPAAPLADTAAGEAPTLGGCPIFPADSPWNTEVASAPVDPRSARYIANINAHGDTTLHPDFGSSREYGMPYVVVPATQAGVPVRFTEYGDESDRGPYPIPADAPIEGGNDHHVLVVQQGTCRLFELYHAAHTPEGWTAGSGAVWDLRSNRGRHEEWTSCDQAGLPVLPGLVRYDEVRAGHIHHALRFTVDHTQAAWVPPASHPGGDDDEDAPPMGLHLRLKADYDTRRFHGQAAVVLEALRRYGMIVADTGTNWYISGATDPRWDDDDLRQLASVPGDAFEVVRAPPLRRRRR